MTDKIDIDKFFQRHPQLAISFWTKVHEMQADYSLSEEEITKSFKKMVNEAIRLVRGLRVIEMSADIPQKKEVEK